VRRRGVEGAGGEGAGAVVAVHEEALRRGAAGSEATRCWGGRGSFSSSSLPSSLLPVSDWVGWLVGSGATVGWVGAERPSGTWLKVESNQTSAPSFNALR